MMNESNVDAPALVRRRRRIARQQREKTPEPLAKIGAVKPQKYSDDESSSTTTTTNENEKRRTSATATILSGSTRPSLRSSSRATASNSSGGAGSGSHGNSSNVAYREKILQRRDRGHHHQNHHPMVVRSQSQPREIPPASPTPSQKMPSDSSGNVIRFLRKAKRSLSIPRRRRDVACETSPIRTHDEVIKRYAKSPIPAKIEPPKSDGVNGGNDTNSRLTKLEMNIKRFEDERHIFAMEKEKFEREKRHMEQQRFQRLLEFERKRSMQQMEREQLAMQAAAIALAEIEKQRNNQHQARHHSNQRSGMGSRSSKSRERSFSGGSNIIYADDYESSTATSSSSRDGDFADFAPEIPFNGSDEPPLNSLEDLAEPPLIEIKLDSNHVANTEHDGSIAINGSAVSMTSPQMDQPDHRDEPAEPKQSLISRLLFGKAKSPTIKPMAPHPKRASYSHIRVDDGGPISIWRIVFVESPLVWHQVIELRQREWEYTMRLRNRCIANFLLLTIFFGFGGLAFRVVEGSFENFYKCGVRRVKRDFVDHLWSTSHDLSEDDWKSLARSKLRGFEEELHIAHEAGQTTYSGLKAWTFINGVVYCLTVVTTIGYGHIAPATNTGRAITIVYAIFGIPIFLILLADFGKLFTRGIKFVWAFVRRLYYTGSLRRVRKQPQVQQMMRNMSIAYDYATFRRPSQVAKEADLEQPQTATTLSVGAPTDTPTTPIPPEIEIDDEFNLPISLAIFILIAYIFCGAIVYSYWEGWTFFESCYFVFVSMSTIGFGDYVPQHPMRMMVSIVYLIFGLSLTSMCINVVQMKLSNSFRKASAKIGATIGLSLAEEEALSSQNVSPTPNPDDLSVHSYGRKDSGDPQKDAALDSGVYDNAEMRDGRFVLTPPNQPLPASPPPISIDTVDRSEPDRRELERREPPSNLTVRSPPRFPSTGNVYID